MEGHVSFRQLSLTGVSMQGKARCLGGECSVNAGLTSVCYDVWMAMECDQSPMADTGGTGVVFGGLGGQPGCPQSRHQLISH